MYDGNRRGTDEDASPFLLAIVLCLCQGTIIEQKQKHRDRLLVLNAAKSKNQSLRRSSPINPEAQMDPFCLRREGKVEALHLRREKVSGYV